MTIAALHREPPISPARLGTWFFIAADIMFFTGLIAAYFVVRSPDPELFTKSSESFNRFSGCINTAILCLSAITMMMAVNAAKSDIRKSSPYLIATLLLGSAFLSVECVDYFHEYHHVSIVAPDTDGRAYIYDGVEHSSDHAIITLHGHRRELLPNVPFDIHQITPADVITRTDFSPRAFTLRRETISQIVRYGPSKNIFYAFYYLLTAAHAVHLLAAAPIILVCLIQIRGGQLQYPLLQNTAIYWCYITAVWLFLAPLMYLV